MAILDTSVTLLTVFFMIENLAGLASYRSINLLPILCL